MVIEDMSEVQAGELEVLAGEQSSSFELMLNL
jgi:hypothetical protein